MPASLFVLGALLLFARLGHYAIWDDEAMIALIAKGVLSSGDTTAVLGNNMVLYHDGILVRDLHDRSTPPLSAYLAALSLRLFGETALAARLPPAFFGLGSLGLIVWWMRKDRASLLTQSLVGLALLGNVSFFLYCRQCRYYAAAVFLSLAITYLYLNWRGSRAGLLSIAALSVALFAASYLNYLVLYGCIAVDYFVWRRKEKALAMADWVALFAPQILLCGLLTLVWNPLRTPYGEVVQRNGVAEKLMLFFWNWRDVNKAEMLPGILLLAAPVAGFIHRDRWLLRGSLAVFCYVTFMTIVSPQVINATSEADVRYLVPLIPLGALLGSMTLMRISGNRPWIAIPGALVAFGTNLLQGGPLLYCGFRSTPIAFAGELWNPPRDPYTVTSQWINEHVRAGETVWSVPYYTCYPLMFHAPQAVYAWQLPDPPPPQFDKLDPIHFRGRMLPDYVVAFGPFVQEAAGTLQKLNRRNVTYDQVATIDHYWRDMHRPELFWRTFVPITKFNRNYEAIYIFKLRKS